MFSSNGRYVAVLSHDNVYLTIYNIEEAGTTTLTKSIELSTHHRNQTASTSSRTPSRSQHTTLQWSRPESPAEDSARLLICTGNHISVYDIRDESWSAEITLGEMTSIPYIDFGSTHDSILVFNEFNTALHVLLLAPSSDLNTTASTKSAGQHLLIKSPKSPPHSYFLRPRTSHLALLTKQDTSDLLTVFTPATYNPIGSTKLPTIDAQGVEWSPDGAWLAVWDVAALGTKVVLLTAEGGFYNTYTGDDDDAELKRSEEADEKIGGYSGVSQITWSNDSRFLALGMADGRIEIINATRLKLSSLLSDPMRFGSVGREIHIEQFNPSSGVATYAPVPQQDTFPYAFDKSKDKGPGNAISHLQFNASGKLLAAVDAGISNVLWIWSTVPSKLNSRGGELVGTLIQKSAIKQVAWHPESPELLMTVNDDGGVMAGIHQWRVFSEEGPQIARVGDAIAATEGAGGNTATGKGYARWITGRGKTEEGLICYAWRRHLVIGYVHGKGEDCELRVFSKGVVN
ncbi:hypothetical protein KEM56_003278 [Ascosphaera pollenicola]|nr:hypothetical protein KEM56_003278 [Ascosphaera pollenicola]